MNSSERKINIYWLKLTYILQIKLSHVSESYISQFHYVTQENQDMKAYLFKFEEGRSSHLEVFLVKSVLKICIKLTGELPWRSVISIKLQSNFIEITLRVCSPVNLLNISRIPFSNNTSGWLVLTGKR